MYRISDINNIESYITIYPKLIISYKIVVKITFSIDDVEKISNMKKEDYPECKNNIFKFSFWKCNESKTYPVDIKEKYFDNFVWDLLNTVINDYNKYFLNIMIQTNTILDTYKINLNNFNPE